MASLTTDLPSNHLHFILPRIVLAFVIRAPFNFKDSEGDFAFPIWRKKALLPSFLFTDEVT